MVSLFLTPNHLLNSEESVVAIRGRGQSVGHRSRSSLGLAMALVIVGALLIPVTVHAGKRPKVERLVAELKKCEGLEECAAVKALVKQRKTFWPKLSVGLQDPDEMIRFWTLGVLSKAPTKAAVGAIALRLDDAKIRVRAAAAYALGALKSKEVVPHLIKALTDKDLNVRFAAVVAMGRVQVRAFVEVLIKACRDRDEDVRAPPCWPWEISGTLALHGYMRDSSKTSMRRYGASLQVHSPSSKPKRVLNPLRLE